MKILIVSNDPAGAELVSSWVVLNKKHTYRYMLGLPAREVFKKKINLTDNDIFSIEKVIKSFDLVLTGTSQNSSLEKEAIIIAKKNQIKVISFLDYWVNFKIRFQYNGFYIYPDEIWVTDKYALKNAKKELPGANIKLKNNPYISELLSKKVENLRNLDSFNILYVCQPYFEDGLSDIEALDYFFSLVKSLKKQNIKVKLRLHPLEESSKYNDIIEKFKKNFEISLSVKTNLSIDLNWSNVVIGMHAQALAVSVEFGIKTFFCIPPNGKKCILPHKEITDFEVYVKLN